MRVTTLKKVRIAARQSDLARLQAEMVGARLSQIGIAVEYDFRSSLGDLNLQDPLWKMPAKGVFTEDFLVDLTSGRADVVVHSWKDLPTEPREKTEIVATLPRADARDLFLFRRDRLAGKPRHLRVLTSSPRRAYNLEQVFKTYLPFPVETVEFLNVRGNIPTRVRKLLAEDVDGLIVAKAAFDRLLESTGEEYAGTRSDLRAALEACRWMVLPLTLNPTAAAQGALAIEICRDRVDLKEIFARIHCEETFACVQEERRILAKFGGGCHQKIGITVLRRPYGDVLALRGLTDRGERLDRFELRAPPVVERAARATDLWPTNADLKAADLKTADDEGFFTREPLPRESWAAELEGARFVWVARAGAWPEGASSGASAERIVWCAGLKTWQKLAERGIWVNGCAEGLGEENEATRVETLCGLEPGASIDWLKLTHEASAQRPTSSGRALATYRLVPTSEPPDLRGKTHFYWASGSAFDRALQLFPEIRSGYHACGPGHTYRRIREVLGADAKLSIVLSRQAWRESVAPSETDTPGTSQD